MNLTVTTPLGIIIDNENVFSLRAEDATGSFGILSGHADFTTVLGNSVISWCNESGEMSYCAVCKGLLTVTKGSQIFIATREAVAGSDLADLKNRVLAKYHLSDENEIKSRLLQERLHAEAIKNIQKYLHQEDRFDAST